MAHKKAGGSTRNGRDSKSKRLGVKVYGGQIINAGGIISVYHEQIGDINSQKVMDMTSNIYDKVTDVLKFSQENDTSTYNAAIQLAKNRIHNISEK